MRTTVSVLGHNPAINLSEYATPDWYNVQPRGFGDRETGLIQAQVVVDEDHEDDLNITSHPVQMGVVVHDHAFKQPATVRVRMGWTNGYAYDTNNNNVRGVYEDILRLQARRLPFTVYTGKRAYENMLVASLRTHTDQKLEFTLMADVEFREIVLVGTSVGTGVGTQDSLGDPESLTPQSERGPIWLIANRMIADFALRSGIPLYEIQQFATPGGPLYYGFSSPLPTPLPPPTLPTPVP